MELKGNKTNGNRSNIPQIVCPEVRQEVLEAIAVFPAKIRGLREAQGLSLREAAEDMGMNKQTIGQYEQGINFPDARRLLTIACYYGVSLDWLFGRDF